MSFIPNTVGVVQYENSTALSSGASADSGWFDCSIYASVAIRVHASGTGTYTIFFSADGSTNHSTITYTYYGSSSEFFFTPKFFDIGAKYARVTFTNNSGVNYTESFLQVILSPSSKTIKVGRNRTLPIDVDSIPMRLADELDVMRGLVQGEYIITKFSRNADIDMGSVPEDIWGQGGLYTGFPTTTAETFEVASSSANDTAAGTGARTVRFYYYDDEYNMFDSSGNFLFFDVTLNGTSYVSSGVSGMRIWRGKVLTVGSGETNDGDLTCRWDSTTSAVFAFIGAGVGQTEISNFTIPNGYRGYLKRYDCEMLDNTSNDASISIAVRDFDSGIFRLTRPFTVNTESNFRRSLYGGVEYDEKTDLVFRCTSVGGNNGTVTVNYSVHLVKN